GHWWVALVGTGGCTAGHRWVALLGTGGCTAGHRLVALLGTGGRTARHRWVHCWALMGSTAGWHCWARIIRALIINALMIGANPCSDNCGFSTVRSPRSDSVRKVQPRTGNC
ncbi:unnamed protein product, partial [Staurois parvus]